MKIPEVSKRPNEMFSVGLQYITPDLEEGASLASAIVTITPDEVGGLKKSGNVVIEPTVVSQLVYGGIVNKEYYVIFKVTTTGGHVYEDSIFVKIRDITV